MVAKIMIKNAMDLKVGITIDSDSISYLKTAIPDDANFDIIEGAIEFFSNGQNILDPTIETVKNCQWISKGTIQHVIIYDFIREFAEVGKKILFDQEESGIILLTGTLISIVIKREGQYLHLYFIDETNPDKDICLANISLFDSDFKKVLIDAVKELILRFKEANEVIDEDKDIIILSEICAKL